MPKGIFKNPIERGRKISETKKRLKQRPFSRLGKKHSEESKKKMSISHKGRFGGEKHSNWKGGITKIHHLRTTLEYKLWREAVWKRDNWTCQFCAKRGGKLEAHHIFSFAQYPQFRLTINNGITLCQKCHKRKGRPVINQ